MTTGKEGIITTCTCLTCQTLTREILATESILEEGDPFMITREQYLENLKWLRGDLIVIE